MNTEITIIASIFLLLGGLAAFPFTLDYSNTSWMPRWMRPDVDYLERPFRYDYPGTDRAKRICSQIQKGRGIFADSRPYYVVVSRRCHSTRYQFQLTTEGEHQKRILLDGNIRVQICRKFDSLSAASLYRLQLVEQYWNTYYNNFFRYESRARSEFEEELKCDGTGEKESGSSI